jgi:hypothetical protein
MTETLKRRLLHDVEVVEDSEPEREEKRQQMREQARKKKRLRMDPSRADLEREVIELTDAELNPSGPSATVGGQSRIDKSISGEGPLLIVSQNPWCLCPLRFQLQATDGASFFPGT